MVNLEVQHWELRVDHGQATLVNILNQYQATIILNLALALICQRAQQGQSHKSLEMSKFFRIFENLKLGNLRLMQYFSNALSLDLPESFGPSSPGVWQMPNSPPDNYFPSSTRNNATRNDDFPNYS